MRQHAADSNLCCLHLQLWENLIYDTEVKDRLLQYSESALIFSDHKVPAI